MDLGPVRHPDGDLRCPWVYDVRGAPIDVYVAYHDGEWGKALHGDAALFERISLEAFQSGLSWLTILRKRPAFREAFAGFDPWVVANFDDSDRARLLADRRIVRNRAKVDATLSNARAVVRMCEAHGDGALDRVVWQHAPASAGKPTRPAPQTITDVPAVTPESDRLARALKASGFRFIGPTTAYALMQAIGMVNDHLEGCRAR